MYSSGSSEKEARVASSGCRYELIVTAAVVVHERVPQETAPESRIPSSSYCLLTNHRAQPAFEVRRQGDGALKH